jgi:predicted HTH domain antitoxin
MEDRITNEKNEVAINLLALGRLTLEEIAKATGLAIETVTALAKEKTD